MESFPVTEPASHGGSWVCFACRGFWSGHWWVNFFQSRALLKERICCDSIGRQERNSGEDRCRGNRREFIRRSRHQRGCGRCRMQSWSKGESRGGRRKARCVCSKRLVDKRISTFGVFISSRWWAEGQDKRIRIWRCWNEKILKQLIWIYCVKIYKSVVFKIVV